MLKLGVNIDHVATLRQARYAGRHLEERAEPDPVALALIAEGAGAHSITAHLREDRRHMQDSDIERLREEIDTRLNLEMANIPAMTDFAARIRPEEVCLVPERRLEVTTEGGLDAVAQKEELRPTIESLKAAGIRVSLFVAPDDKQIIVASQIGADIVELHTGSFAEAATPDDAEKQLARLRAGAVLAESMGLQVNAGHGINYKNIAQILTLPHLTDLNIGHSIVSRGLIVGLGQAVSEMAELMRAYEGGSAEIK
jgi:pyridoxine 5-phosphate synthase